MRAAILAITILLLSSCAARAPVPLGQVPIQTEVASEDEQYGHQVFSALTEKYPIDRNDSNIERVRNVVDRLTAAAKADKNPWHVYVLKDDGFKNAAATKGNYIFVWTGMLNAARNGEELAVVLAHEIGHVLAGHTVENPAEEARRMTSGVVASVAREIVAQQGPYGALAGLAGVLVQSSIDALLVNPEAQRKEYEADQVGLFLMADAGYDPEGAIAFWSRVSKDPDFSGFPIEFLSSHPSSDSRLERLKEILPMAAARYRGEPVPSGASAPLKNEPAAPARRGSRSEGEPKALPPQKTEKLVKPKSRGFALDEWRVEAMQAALRERPDDQAPAVAQLPKGTQVTVKGIVNRRWLEVLSPRAGFLRSRDLSPLP